MEREAGLLSQGRRKILTCNCMYWLFKLEKYRVIVRDERRGLSLQAISKSISVLHSLIPRGDTAECTE